MQKWLIVLGVVAIIAGLLWPWLSRVPFGRLPGDIVWEGEHGKVFFPITTMILISLILTLILNWKRWF